MTYWSMAGSSGILVEMSCELDRIHHIIVGIGINVHAFVRDPGTDVSAITVNLDELIGAHVQRVRLLASVLASTERYYRTWLNCGFAPILAEAKALSCTLGRVYPCLHLRGWSRALPGIWT